ncbi:MAG: hypothetical protein UT39_C0003G0022 [Candidatus Woesebacteria bacterium GW2011_GWA1_39_21]|uniref:O-antigen ligase-related domain-containing protein n=1 Tax=Candidatus Woesebacteria bacterium GW2011_GWA1_39_21 TaxID=1618550 RepID=A0A0G0N8I3_9BACT|nr:MAG: hypothetical protein UT39_C0003G0022 [Candidatus Woesebacteria bacterium GW2011_GWA1_39_21]
MQKLSNKFNQINKYLVAALILTIPLYQKFPFIGVPGTFVSIRMEDFLVLLSVTVFIIINFKNVVRYAENPIFKSVFLFFALASFSLLSAILITKTISPTIGVIHLIRRVEYMSMLFIGYSAIFNNRNNLSFYVKLILIVVFLSFTYGLGQRYFEWPIIITQNEEYSKGIALRFVEGGHINSTFAGHYDLATYLVMVMPLILNIFFFIKRGVGKYIFFVAYLCGLWLLVNSASRIAMVSLLLSASLALLLTKKFVKAIPILILSILFIGFSSNLIVRYERLFTIVGDEAKRIFSYQITSVYAQGEDGLERRESALPTPTPLPIFEDRSTSIRLNVEWPRAIRAFVKNPLYGTGYSSITLATDNDYLRALGETGLLGFISFALVIAWLVLNFIKIYRESFGFEKVFLSGIFGSLFGVLLNAMFIDVFEASKIALSFWLFMGMALALKVKKYEKTI